MLNNSNYMSYQQAFDLAKKILDEENKKNNMHLTVEVFNFKTYYSSDFFKKDYKLSTFGEKVHDVLLPVMNTGVYYGELHHDDGYIIVFPNTHIYNSIIVGSKHFVTDIAKTCFHEIVHAKQDNSCGKQSDEYRYFERIPIKYMENSILRYDGYFYRMYHDSFYMEIDANLKGIIMTENYLRDNYPDIYEHDKDYINIKRINYEYQLKNYNFDFFFETILSIYATNPKKYYYYFYGKANVDFYPIPSLFCNPGSSEFKSVKDIMEIYEILTTKNVDKDGNKIFISKDEEMEYFELFAAVLTSDVYLNQIDFDSLDDDEKRFLDLACLYSLNKEKDREEYNKNVKYLSGVNRASLYFNILNNKSKIKKLKSIIQILDVNSLDNSIHR